MDQLLLTISVVALFLLRIGLPVIVLIAVGVVIDRWQTHREKYPINATLKSHNHV
jgi:hypothetical protein